MSTLEPDLARGPGAWIGRHLPALLYGWFFFGMFLCGFLAPDESFSYGRPVGVSLGPDGSLRLDLDDGGRRYISAGDVFFPDGVATDRGRKG